MFPTRFSASRVTRGVRAGLEGTLNRISRLTHRRVLHRRASSYGCSGPTEPRHMGSRLRGERRGGRGASISAGWIPFRGGPGARTRRGLRKGAQSARSFATKSRGPVGATLRLRTIPWTTRSPSRTATKLSKQGERARRPRLAISVRPTHPSRRARPTRLRNQRLRDSYCEYSESRNLFISLFCILVNR